MIRFIQCHSINLYPKLNEMENELSRETLTFLPPDRCNAIGASCCCCHVLPAMMALPHTVGQLSAFCSFRFSSRGYAAAARQVADAESYVGVGLSPGEESDTHGLKMFWNLKELVE